MDNETYDSGVKKIISENVLDLQTVLGAAPFLIKSGKYEETSYAITLTKKFERQYDERAFHKIENWFEIGIINWAHTDSIALDILSLFLLNKIVPMDDFKSWLKAENKYQRRAAPVAFIKLAKSGKNIKQLLKFINPLMLDEAREVHQGVGWFLREARVINHGDVEKFLIKWKDSAPRLIFQYATEKMTPADKLRFKRDKS